MTNTLPSRLRALLVKDMHLWFNGRTSVSKTERPGSIPGGCAKINYTLPGVLHVIWHSRSRYYITLHWAWTWWELREIRHLSYHPILTPTVTRYHWHRGYGI